MNKFISYTRKWLVGTCSLTALLWFTSCEKFFDYEGDCDPHYFVSFIYDMNMEGADSFDKQVSSVDLFIFDAATGRFVDHYAEKGEPLKQKGYLMPIYVDPGEYEFVAWCGLANNEGSYSIPDINQISTIEDLNAVLARKHDAQNKAYSNANLNFNSNSEPCALYHGKIAASLPDVQGKHYYEVPLTRDTNNLIVSIWHHFGDLSEDHYEFSLVYTDESNATMGYNNLPLADEDISYRPWSTESGILDMGARAETGSGSRYNYIKAEIAMGRLLEGQRPRLIIRDTDAGEVRLDIDFLYYVEMMRSANYAKMGNQEYFDRQYEYSLVVILDTTWTGFQLVVNGWHVIEGDSHL